MLSAIKQKHTTRHSLCQHIIKALQASDSHVKCWHSLFSSRYVFPESATSVCVFAYVHDMSWQSKLDLSHRVTDSDCMNVGTLPPSRTERQFSQPHKPHLRSEGQQRPTLHTKSQARSQTPTKTTKHRPEHLNWHRSPQHTITTARATRTKKTKSS